MFFSHENYINSLQNQYLTGILPCMAEDVKKNPH